MATEKLYDTNAYLRRFEARVEACEPAKGGFRVRLDRSAFYPEGGGQPYDRGTLGGLPVLEAHEREGEVEHLLPSPLTPGEMVTGEINWARRFDLMQQHSGEHILSGMLCRRFGCDNVGFHIGAETVTVDFNCLPEEKALRALEAEVNAYIWENHPVEISFPEPEALQGLEYRSKKTIAGQVRIVSFPGADTCACCGTHVSRSGEVGLVKLLDWRRFREGIRIEMVCGARAWGRFDAVERENREISALLSAKPLETAAAAKRLLGERDDLQYRLYGLEQESFRRTAEALRDAGDVLLLREPMPGDALRRLTAAVLETCGGRCAVFAGRDGDWKYAYGGPEESLGETLKALNSALRGRGGGKKGFAQGSAEATRQEIVAFFQGRGIGIRG